MGGPASFSRLMDLIMEGAENIITYIDDVMIHSKSHADHLRHIREALRRIRAAHMRLNLQKCIFVSSSVQYLGHTITAKGIMPGKEKTEAIAKASAPTCQKKLRSFLGLANYFRACLLYTSPSPRDKRQSRMPSSA